MTYMLTITAELNNEWGLDDCVDDDERIEIVREVLNIVDLDNPDFQITKVGQRT